MSSQTEKVFRELQKYLENNEPQSEADFQQKLAGFQAAYNAKLINDDFEKTPLDEAYDLLEKAEECMSVVEARKLAKRAYKLSDACFDAVIFLSQNAPNPEEASKILNDGLKREKERLKREGLYIDENIGSFYSIFETRPYIRGLCEKSQIYISDGKMRKASEVCEEILHLNESDNLGMRYHLMAIYSLLEDVDCALELYKKYPEDSFFMTFSLFLLYYRLDNQKLSEKYLARSLKLNKYLKEFFESAYPRMYLLKCQQSDDYQLGYSHGEKNEVCSYFDSFGYAIPNLENLTYYVRRYIKQQNKN